MFAARYAMLFKKTVNILVKYDIIITIYRGRHVYHKDRHRLLQLINNRLLPLHASLKEPGIQIAIKEQAAEFNRFLKPDTAVAQKTGFFQERLFKVRIVHVNVKGICEIEFDNTQGIVTPCILP